MWVWMRKMGICRGGRALVAAEIHGGVRGGGLRSGRLVVGRRGGSRGRECSRMRCRGVVEVAMVFLDGARKKTLSVGKSGTW